MDCSLVPEEYIQKNIERLIDDYGKDVLRVSYLYLKDRHKAEDAFQEVFLKVYKKYHSFNGNSSEKTWIIRITINTCKDFLRSSWVRRVILNGDNRPSEIESDMESMLIQKSDNRYLFEQVINLPQKYKDVTLLYYYEDFNTRGISDILGIPEGTVRSRLHKAREILRTNLKGGIDYIG